MSTTRLVKTLSFTVSVAIRGQYTLVLYFLRYVYTYLIWCLHDPPADSWTDCRVNSQTV